MKRNFFFVSMLLTGSFLLSAPSMAQDKVIKLTTAKALEQPITLLVNRNSNGITVDWGDGNAVTYQTMEADGICKIEGTVKGKVISISGNANWNMLSCKDCGLTDIDLSQAKQLNSLYCQNNQLTSLNLSGMTQLTDLNCANNQISDFVFTNSSSVSSDLASIENLNISNNKLEGRYYYKLNNLQQLNISNNQFDTFYIYDPELRSVDCSNNKLNNILNLRKSEKVSNVICNGNDLNAIILANDGENLQQIYCDNNQITSLNIANALKLSDLVCNNNKLGVLATNRKAKMDVMNVSNNNLSFSCLPSKSYAPDYMTFEPQGPFNISKAPGMLQKEGIPYAPITVNWSDNRANAIDLSDAGTLANGRYDASQTWLSVNADGTETELVQRKSSSTQGDFYASRGKYSFYTPQKKAYLKLTSNTYGYTICSTPIAIGDDVTGVDELVATDNGLEILATSGAIILNSTAAKAVDIYTVDGKKVWHDTVSGTVTVNLPKGIYMVNGKKVIL